jgi:small-conductance mechanosensitive channel
LAGAAGVGIGFGLQNIINNFVSGLIILFERPIKIGDRVDVGSVHGDVVSISARSTTVITNDNIAIIVPNSEFISSKVTNWSYQDRKVRFDIPVGVSYSSELDVVTQLLLEVASQHAGVLATPKSTVLFEEFGDSSLNFTLQVWTRQYAALPRVLRSELNYAIARIFKQNDIEIPFPQRDVHVRNGGLEARSAAT